MTKQINLWDKVVEIDYRQLDWINDALHRAIFYYSKNQVIPDEEIAYIVNAYKLTHSIIDKNFKGWKYTAKEVQKIIDSHK